MEELYRRVSGDLICMECGGATKLPKHDMVHGSGCQSSGGFAALTARQQEVAMNIARGNSVKETAFLLGLAWKTVEVHRSAIYRRLGIQSSVALVHLLYRSGILPEKPPAEAVSPPPAEKPPHPWRAQVEPGVRKQSKL